MAICSLFNSIESSFGIFGGSESRIKTSIVLTCITWRSVNAKSRQLSRLSVQKAWVGTTDSTSTHWCIVSTSRWFVKPGGSVGYHELKAAMRALMLPVKRLGFRNLKNEVKAEGRPGESWWRSDSVVPEICPFSSLGGAHTDAATVVRGESLPRHGSEDFLMLMQLNQESWCVGSNAGLRAQSWCCSTACKYCGRRRTQ